MGDVSNVNDGVVYGPLLQVGHADSIVLPVVPPEAMGALPVQEGVFVGRVDEVKALVAALRPGKGRRNLPGEPTVVVLSGPAGVGKKALAVHVAERMKADKTYRGVLYVDLRDEEATGAVDPYAALGGFLVSMGIGREKDIPPRPVERSRMYLSRMRDWALRGRPVLVLLDGVGSAGHITPLLPGRGHGVLVISRHGLAEVDGRHVQLGPLTERESVDLLAARLTAHEWDVRVLREPDAALTLAQLCGRLPFALTIATAILNDDPRMRIADLVTDLRNAAGERLATLRFNGLDLRVLLDQSYRRLEPHQKQTFRLLCLFPGPHVSVEAAAALTRGISVTVKPRLDTLRRANLIMPAEVDSSYVVPDLVRLYGAEVARYEEPATSAQEAMDRLFRYYRATTAEADDIIRLGVTSSRFPTRAKALRWLDDEWLCLAAVVRHGHETGRDDDAIDLALRQRYFFELRRHWDVWTSTAAIALACARRNGNRGAQARLLEAVGDAFRLQKAWDAALAHYDQAREIYRDLDEQAASRGVTDSVMSIVSVRRGHLCDAVRHYRDAVRRYRELGEHRRRADALNNLGLTYLALGDLTKALDSHRRAFGLRCEMHDTQGQARSLTNLGNVHLREDRLDVAVRCYTDAATLFEKCDDHHGQAEALANLGAAQLASGDVREARETWQQSMTTFPDEATQRGDIRDRLSGIHTIARWRNTAWARTIPPYAYLVVFPLTVTVAWEAWPDAPEDRNDQARHLDLRQLDITTVAAAPEIEPLGTGTADDGYPADSGDQGSGGSGDGSGSNTHEHGTDRDENEQDKNARRVGTVDAGGYDSSGYDAGSGGGGWGSDYGSGYHDHHDLDGMW